ncbi:MULTISPECIES: ribonuclease Z [unclassified Prochlorococcus]|uniref:ribonuclease Z n=1 Tax=unclassified Prochlorococcus TaxID=2627481 RepID=UPI000533AE13|nr:MULTISPECIES: ribonuclease Z [unclassified Prochlorococcus]KGG16206.1 Ribonuclease Z [Prochlorococcus sp. MIT 0603]KGG18059.1 Ribonuclease Z [Prochlorococcus sp. MIT 0602]
MQITFLGTSSGVPTRSRNVSAVALRLPQRSEIWLFDCGEGTQHQLIRSELRTSQLTKIFITHMHGDHVYGLPGLLASLGLAGNSTGVELYGPNPLKSFLEGVFKASSSRVSYPMQIHSIEKLAEENKIIYEDNEFIVRSSPLVHRVPSFAYRVDQKPKPGRFNISKAKGLGIPPGPVYAELQEGKTVRLNDGRTFEGKDFCGPKRLGTSFVYCTDTVFAESAIRLAKGADLLIHEATFAHNDSQLAYERQHSTSTMAAQIASAANVGQLVLTHLSPRYAPGNKLSPNNLLTEAKAIFPNTLLAKDFLQIEIQKPATVRDTSAQ